MTYLGRVFPNLPSLSHTGPVILEAKVRCRPSPESFWLSLGTEAAEVEEQEDDENTGNDEDVD